MPLAILIAGGVSASLFFFNDIFRAQSLIGLLAIAGFIASITVKKIHWSVALFFMYFSLVSLRITFFPQSFWIGVDIATMTGLQSLVTEAYLYLSLILVSFLFIKKEHVGILKNTMILLGIIDANVILVKYFWNMPWFLFNNPAFDAAFLSCTLPLILSFALKLKIYPIKTRRVIQVWLIGLPIGLCIASKSSSGIGGPAIALGVYFLMACRLPIKVKVFAFATSSFCLGLIGLAMQGEQFFHSNGRSHVWKLAFDFWFSKADKLFGTGPGTFLMYGPGLQINEAVQTGVTEIAGFIWMHSTQLQVLFETGYIGLGLSLLVYGMALWKSKKSPEYFSALLTLFLLSFIQMAERHFIFAYFGAYLIFEAFTSTPKEIPKKAGEA